MEKVNLKIEDFEDKKAQSGKRYTRFKTDQGWMSVFEKDLIEKLKDLEGQYVSVGVAVDKEKGFKNIRALYGVTEEKIEEQTKEPVKKPQGSFGQVTMYTSYCKDVYIALEEGQQNIEIKQASTNLMKEAIKLVKQAREAFE